MTSIETQSLGGANWFIRTSVIHFTVGTENISEVWSNHTFHQVTYEHLLRYWMVRTQISHQILSAFPLRRTLANKPSTLPGKYTYNITSLVLSMQNTSGRTLLARCGLTLKCFAKFIWQQVKIPSNTGNLNSRPNELFLEIAKSLHWSPLERTGGINLVHTRLSYLFTSQ